MVEVDLTQASQSLSEPVKLQRPFGKIRLLATDALGEYNKQEERPGEVTVDFKDAVIPSVFDALAQKVKDEATMNAGKLTFTAVCEDASVNTTEYENSYLLGYSYIFASGEIPSYSMDVEVKGDQEGSGVIGTRSLSSIPVQANKLTTVIGNFYTNEGSIDVIVDDMFDGDDIEVPVTETLVVTPDDDLQKIIDEAEDNAVIILEPGVYNQDITLAGFIEKNGNKATITVKGGDALTRSSAQESVTMIGTLFGDRLSTDQVYPELKVIVDGITFKYEKKADATNVACIGNISYNAIGELIVQNCTFIPNDQVVNNYFIATNHNPNDKCRSVIKLYNNKIGSADVTIYNSYYPVRLWNVKNVEVIGNEFTMPEDFAGTLLNISKLSASEDASVVVKNNKFTNGRKGIAVTPWLVGESNHSENTFKGKIEISGNEFVNVAPTSMTEPELDEVPVYVAPKFVDDDINGDREKDHGMFDTFVVVENNTYSGYTPRENVIVSNKVAIRNSAELKSAIKNQTDGQTWYVYAGEYDLGEPAQADTPGPNGYYFKVDKSLSLVGNGEVTITTSHEAERNIGGNGSLQNLITVDAANVSFKNITFKANYNGYYGGPNKIIEVRNTGFSISDCKFIPNEKAPEDCGSAVYFSQKADNGVVENCEINYATVSFDGLMEGNFTVKGNKFVEGNGNFAITTPNWTSNDVTTSNLYVNLEGNNFEGFEEFNGSNPAIRGYYGILNLKDNKFPSDGQYWKASQFGSIFVDYDSPVSQTWTKDSNEPKSFAISNDIIELETTTDKETYGKMVGHGATVPGMTTDADMWEVVSMLTITDERQPVGKRIFVDVEEEGSVVEYVGIQFVRDENGNGKWQYYYANADDGEPWIPFENINTEPGEYEVKITYDNGIITYSIISIEGVSYIKDIPLSTSNTRISAIYLISKVCENSYKTTWSYPIVNF